MSDSIFMQNYPQIKCTSSMQKFLSHLRCKLLSIRRFMGLLLRTWVFLPISLKLKVKPCSRISKFGFNLWNCKSVVFSIFQHNSSTSSNICIMLSLPNSASVNIFLECTLQIYFSVYSSKPLFLFIRTKSTRK